MGGASHDAGEGHGVNGRRATAAALAGGLLPAQDARGFVALLVVRAVRDSGAAHVAVRAAPPIPDVAARRQDRRRSPCSGAR